MLKPKSLISTSSISLLALTVVFTAVGYQGLQAQETDNSTTIEEISEDEDNALGEEVTVRGEVEQVESEVSFSRSR